MSGGNTKWLVIIGGALVGSLLVNAYFIGQRNAAPPPPVAVTPAAPEPPKEQTKVISYGDRSDPTAARLEEGPSGELVIRNHGDDEDVEPKNVVKTAPAPVPAPAADNDKAAIAAYFADVDNVTSDNSGVGGKAYAHSIVQASLKGDTAELEKLQRDLETMRSAMKRLSPPAACAAYHKQSLQLLDTSADMLKDLKKMLTTKDTDGIGAVTQTAQRLQSQTRALEKMRERLQEG